MALQHFEDHLRMNRNFAANTKRAYVSDIKRWVEFVEKMDSNPSNINLLDLFIQVQLEKGVAPSSLSRQLVSLRLFFMIQVPGDKDEFREMIRVAAEKLPRMRRLPKIAHTHDVRVFLTKQHQAAKSELARPEITLRTAPAYVTFIASLLMVSTGARVSEVCGLASIDVDLNDRKLVLHGKGAKVRVAYLPARFVTPLLGDYLKMRGNCDLDHDMLLVNRQGRPLSAGALQYRFRCISSKFSLKQPITPHMLRHAAATDLMNSGVDIRMLQVLLGHSSIKTTEIYTHVTNSALKQAMDAANTAERLYFHDK
jgi:integrase/recombinase XerD